MVIFSLATVEKGLSWYLRDVSKIRVFFFMNKK